MKAKQVTMDLCHPYTRIGNNFSQVIVCVCDNVRVYVSVFWAQRYILIISRSGLSIKDTGQCQGQMNKMPNYTETYTMHLYACIPIKLASNIKTSGRSRLILLNMKVIFRPNKKIVFPLKIFMCYGKCKPLTKRYPCCRLYHWFFNSRSRVSRVVDWGC